MLSPYSSSSDSWVRRVLHLRDQLEKVPQLPHERNHGLLQLLDKGYPRVVAAGHRHGIHQLADRQAAPQLPHAPQRLVRVPVAVQALLAQPPQRRRERRGRQVRLAVRVEVAVGAAHQEGRLGEGVEGVGQGPVEPVQLVQRDAEGRVVLAPLEQPVLLLDHAQEVARLGVEH
ncbi:hypothetical protein PG985_007919 [Apiospora marii]|uniref:uncharacterized protein n=1 Tax=Apiospora marii TaxID=335849 RepID=UPI00312EDA31